MVHLAAGVDALGDVVASSPTWRVLGTSSTAGMAPFELVLADHLVRLAIGDGRLFESPGSDGG